MFTMPGGSVLRLSNWRGAVFLPARDGAGLSARFRIHDAGMWEWYCGDLDTELVSFAASLRPQCRVAILSNSADGARREEHTRYRFADFFDPVLYSHEIGAAKPDPACYLVTCAALALPPGEVVMVDDVPEFIAGARAVGMQGVLHRTARETAAELSAF